MDENAYKDKQPGSEWFPDWSSQLRQDPELSPGLRESYRRKWLRVEGCELRVTTFGATAAGHSTFGFVSRRTGRDAGNPPR